MSAENVALVEESFRYFVRTGQPSTHVMTSDFAWDMSTFAGWPEKQVYEGAAGVQEFLSAWVATWDEWELDVERHVDAGDRVVAIMRQRGKAKGSGVTVEMVFAQVWTVRDGLLARMEMYADPAEALAAVGVAEGA